MYLYDYEYEDHCEYDWVPLPALISWVCVSMSNYKLVTTLTMAITFSFMGKWSWLWNNLVLAWVLILSIAIGMTMIKGHYSYW